MFELPPHLHPMIVHFPIALFIIALGLDILSFVIKKETFHHSALTLYVIAALMGSPWTSTTSSRARVGALPR